MFSIDISLQICPLLISPPHFQLPNCFRNPIVSLLSHVYFSTIFFMYSSKPRVSFHSFLPLEIDIQERFSESDIDIKQNIIDVVKYSTEFACHDTSQLYVQILIETWVFFIVFIPKLPTYLELFYYVWILPLFHFYWEKKSLNIGTKVIKKLIIDLTKDCCTASSS